MGRPLPATPENLAAARAAAAKLGRLEMRAVKLAKKENMEARETIVYWQDPDFTAHLTAAEKAFFVDECHPILVEAHQRFRASRASIPKAHEKSLHLLYAHMKEHEAFYLDRFFASDHTEGWMDKSIGMLGTYATILRQRGDFHACFEVLQIDWRVLSRLTQVVARNATLPEKTPIEIEMAKENLRALTNKYLLIKNNLRADLVLPVPTGMEPHDEMGPDLRSVMRYEIETDAASQGVCQYLGLLKNAGYPPTLEGLARASNYELWKAHEESVARWRERQRLAGASLSSLPLHGKVKHHSCAGCGRAEPFLNTFMKCGGCGSAFYCARACQKQHWTKEHKGQCKALGERRQLQRIVAPIGALVVDADEPAAPLPPQEQLLPAGATVRIQGLAAASTLNGLPGKVLASRAEPGRVAVRMRDGAVRAIRKENLLVVKLPGSSTV